MKTKKRRFKLEASTKLLHSHLMLWMYSFVSDTKFITKSWDIGYCLYWLNKPWTWFQCYTNGAVKGKDKCYGWHLHFFVFSFEYYNYDYDKVR